MDLTSLVICVIHQSIWNPFKFSRYENIPGGVLLAKFRYRTWSKTSESKLQHRSVRTDILIINFDTVSQLSTPGNFVFNNHEDPLFSLPIILTFDPRLTRPLSDLTLSECQFSQEK